MYVMICVNRRFWRREVELARARRSHVAIDERSRSRGNEMKRSHSPSCWSRDFGRMVAFESLRAPASVHEPGETAIGTTHSTNESGGTPSGHTPGDASMSDHFSRPCTPHGRNRTRRADGSTLTSTKL
jgi:hypothetical protein